MGTPVLAPVAGNVAYVTGNLAGLEFKLTADDGTLFLGSHLSARCVRVGSRPATSSATSATPATPRAGRPHLHFEIHPGGGAAVNPYPLTVCCS